MRPGQTAQRRIAALGAQMQFGSSGQRQSQAGQPLSPEQQRAAVVAGFRRFERHIREAFASGMQGAPGGSRDLEERINNGQSAAIEGNPVFAGITHGHKINHPAASSSLKGLVAVPTSASSAPRSGGQLSASPVAFHVPRKSKDQVIQEITASWGKQLKDGTFRLRDYTPADLYDLMEPNEPDWSAHRAISEQFRDQVLACDPAKGEHFKALGTFHPWQALMTSNAVKNIKDSGEPEPKAAIYLSGWMVAALANQWGILSDQSMHPKTAVVDLVRGINKFSDDEDARLRQEGKLGQNETTRLPIVCDIDAGFGGVGATFLLARELIRAGASAIHIEDQLSDEKKCGHMGGKVLVPTREHVDKLRALRLAADSLGFFKFPIVSRTDALEATLLNKISDPRDYASLKGEYNNNFAALPENAIVLKREGKAFVPEVTDDGFFRIISEKDPNGKKLSRARVVDRHVVFSQYADILWTETKSASLEEVTDIATQVYNRVKGREINVAGASYRPVAPKFAYNNSPSFNWDQNFRLAVLKEWKKIAASPEKDGYFRDRTLQTWLEIGDAAQKEAASKYQRNALLKLDARDPLVVEANKLIAAVSRYNAAPKALLGLEDNDPLVLEADRRIASFQYDTAKIGVAFHFITLPTFHSEAVMMHKMAKDYFHPDKAMLAYTIVVSKYND